MRVQSFFIPVDGVDLPFHFISPSNEERNDLYPLNRSTNIAKGYKKEERMLKEKAFVEIRVDRKRNPMDKSEMNIC